MCCTSKRVVGFNQFFVIIVVVVVLNLQFASWILAFDVERLALVISLEFFKSWSRRYDLLKSMLQFKMCTLCRCGVIKNSTVISSWAFVNYFISVTQVIPPPHSECRPTSLSLKDTLRAERCFFAVDVSFEKLLWNRFFGICDCFFVLRKWYYSLSKAFDSF